MTSIDLENARISLKYGVADLATALETPVSTVRDWLSGRTRIPGSVKVAVELLQEKDKWLMSIIKADLDKRLDKSVRPVSSLAPAITPIHSPLH